MSKYHFPGHGAVVKELQDKLEREAEERNKEGVSKRNPNRWCGRTDLNKVVLFPPAPQGCLPGELLRIKIDRTTENSLFGKIADR